MSSSRVGTEGDNIFLQVLGFSQLAQAKFAAQIYAREYPNQICTILANRAVRDAELQVYFRTAIATIVPALAMGWLILAQ